MGHSPEGSGDRNSACRTLVAAVHPYLGCKPGRTSRVVKCFACDNFRLLLIFLFSLYLNSNFRHSLGLTFMKVIVST